MCGLSRSVARRSRGEGAARRPRQYRRGAPQALIHRPRQSPKGPQTPAEPTSRAQAFHSCGLRCGVSKNPAICGVFLFDRGIETAPRRCYARASGRADEGATTSVEHQIELTADGLWDEVSERLRGALNEATFGTWFGDAAGSELSDDAF